MVDITHSGSEWQLIGDWFLSGDQLQLSQDLCAPYFQSLGTVDDIFGLHGCRLNLPPWNSLWIYAIQAHTHKTPLKSRLQQNATKRWSGRMLVGELCPWLCPVKNSHHHIVYIFCRCTSPLLSSSSPLSHMLCSSVLHPLTRWPERFSHASQQHRVPVASFLSSALYNHDWECLDVSVSPHHPPSLLSLLSPPPLRPRRLLNTDSSPSCHTDWPHPAQ